MLALAYKVCVFFAVYLQNGWKCNGGYIYICVLLVYTYVNMYGVYLAYKPDINAQVY